MITSIGIKSGISNGRPPLEFTCLTRSTIYNARNILQISRENACLEHMQKMQILIINFEIL